MIQGERESVLQRDGTEPGWKELYLLGGIAAIVLVAVMMLSVGLFIIWPNAPGITATVELFTLVQENTLAGLTALDLGVSLSNLVSILLYLALVCRAPAHQSLLCPHRAGVWSCRRGIVDCGPASLRDISRSAISTPRPLTTWRWSRYLAAGEALLVLFHGTAFKNYILLGGLSLLISSWLMLHDSRFGKAAVYIGSSATRSALAFCCQRSAHSLRFYRCRFWRCGSFCLRARSCGLGDRHDCDGRSIVEGGHRD